MTYENKLTIRGTEYQFLSIENEPLMYYMHISTSTVDNDYKIYRNISCDEQVEKWCLVQSYTSVFNGIPKKDSISQDVYCGKEIQSEEFMTTLLEHILEGRGLIES